MTALAVDRVGRRRSFSIAAPRVKRLRVGVLYGGRSGEHEVSLASAAAIFAHIDRRRYEPIALRIEKDGRWVLADRPPSAGSAAEVIEQMRSEVARLRTGRAVFLPPYPGDDTIVLVDRRATGAAGAETAATLTGLGLDVIFPVLHGPYGEDGTVQGLLELAGVPYVGCGVLASAVGMDKAVMKRLFRASGLPVVDDVVILRSEWEADARAISSRVSDALAYPVFVKPANLGSSVGISKVHDRAGLGPAVATSLEFDRKVIVERAVPQAREIECAVLGNDRPEASIPGEIVPSREFYDYEAKYLDSGSRVVIPAPLDAEETAAVRRLAVEAFRAIDGAGLARVDFLLNRSTGDLFVNEINTLPGFTTISMYAKLWAAMQMEFPVLVDRLIALALERHTEKQQLRVSAF
jgi:D-alanine-D-alanine ligase